MPLKHTKNKSIRLRCGRCNTRQLTPQEQQPQLRLKYILKYSFEDFVRMFLFVFSYVHPILSAVVSLKSLSENRIILPLFSKLQGFTRLYGIKSAVYIKPYR